MPKSSPGGVALLGIAQRTIQVKYPVSLRDRNRANILKLKIITAGDWIKLKRLEKNLTLSHVAEKMGIAASLVCSWESSSRQPDSQQLAVLSSVLGFDAKDFKTHSKNPVN